MTGILFCFIYDYCFVRRYCFFSPVRLIIVCFLIFICNSVPYIHFSLIYENYVPPGNNFVWINLVNNIREMLV